MEEVGDLHKEGGRFTTIIEEVATQMLGDILPEGEKVEDYRVEVRLFKSITEEQAREKGYIE